MYNVKQSFFIDFTHAYEFVVLIISSVQNCILKNVLLLFCLNNLLINLKSICDIFLNLYSEYFFYISLLCHLT